MRLLSVLLLFVSSASVAQVITSGQQKALNAYIEFANHSADEMATVMKSIITYYPSLHQKSSWGAPRYTCPIQLDTYYLTNAFSLSKGLSATHSTVLNSKLKELRSAAEKLEEKCKALDTYHKLEDYKQDNFAKAESLINEMQLLLHDYKNKQNLLQSELESVHKKLSAGTSPNAYHKADAMMRAQVMKEAEFLNSWTFNLKSEVYTGWPADKLEKSILDTDIQLKAILQFKPALKYPTASMWTSFQSSLASILELKRNSLDGYNYEAKKSDTYSNDVYLQLINYHKGVLITDYNAFIQYATADNYYGLKIMQYVPVFEIRTQTKVITVDAQPFHDIQHTAIAITPQKTTLTKPMFEALSNYIDYINETWRQQRYLRTILDNFSSSAAYYKSIESYDRHGAMYFDYKDFQLPLSQFQKTITDSKVLVPAIAKSLNDQAEVLLNILKEMNDLSAALDIEVKEKRYEKDRLTKVYKILERQQFLLDSWDDKKELLYQDVRAVNDAYVAKNATSSWYVSGKALQNLTDLDHDALFKAKAHYKGSPAVANISTEKIDAALREVIAKEYDNLKGIERIGRNNGLCPYTPYEDLPVTSKSLSEELRKLKSPTDSRAEHPYHRMLYHYNDIVDDYNKFCELSKDVPHLKTIHQPELFFLKYPEAKTTKPQDPVKVVQVEVMEQPVKKEPAIDKPVIAQDKPVGVKENTKILHDTVYIEKTDTIYIAEPGENVRSMEGYASNNMVLLLDISGSMNSPEKLPLLQKSILDLLSMMRQEDEVSIVAFSGKPKVLLVPSSFKEEEKIKKVINDLTSSGKTDGNAGVKLAYKVADENYIRGGNNRIILATDGEFTVNEETRALIATFSKQDVFLSIFNFGKGAGASKALENLATLGKGNYAYISKANVEMKLISEAKAKRKK